MCCVCWIFNTKYLSFVLLSFFEEIVILTITSGTSKKKKKSTLFPQNIHCVALEQLVLQLKPLSSVKRVVTWLQAGQPLTGTEFMDAGGHLGGHAETGTHKRTDGGADRKWWCWHGTMVTLLPWHCMMVMLGWYHCSSHLLLFAKMF